MDTAERGFLLVVHKGAPWCPLRTARGSNWVARVAPFCLVFAILGLGKGGGRLKGGFACLCLHALTFLPYRHGLVLVLLLGFGTGGAVAVLLPNEKRQGPSFKQALRQFQKSLKDVWGWTTHAILAKTGAVFFATADVFGCGRPQQWFL